MVNKHNPHSESEICYMKIKCSALPAATTTLFHLVRATEWATWKSYTHLLSKECLTLSGISKCLAQELIISEISDECIDCLQVTFPSSLLSLFSSLGVCLEVTKFRVNQIRMQWFSTVAGNVSGWGRNISWSPRADIITIRDLYDPTITLEESLKRKDWGERGPA